VLVTGTVGDMVVGSALVFADRGRLKLRGVPEAGRCTPQDWNQRP
jgi:hypothetical protein